ncbi:MAG: hypothetical protein GKS00_02060 [Alphaproteobacteria bacterium]|nr:hypothetical protein [Alphaproteobacteria bacterium]
MTATQTFYATVSEKTLDKVTQLFNASPSDTLNELVQNSRRAGATRIDVHRIESDLGPAAVFRDDGRGVADPRTLLALGDSDWDAAIAGRESAAGMGFFALSHGYSTIRSRTRDAGTGWSMTLTPDQFTGKAPATAAPHAMEPGTEIIFTCKHSEFVLGRLEAAARYCPVPVYFEGERLDQQDFLADAIHIETWNGVRIGVVQRSNWHDQPVINFHGLTIVSAQTALPDISSVLDRYCYSVRVDIVDCPDLKLVLPARKEVVRDAFFDALKTACTRAMYRAIARQSGHTLSFDNWRKAGALGVDLPEAAAELRPYTPDIADTYNRCVQPPAEVPGNACLVDFDGEAQEQQCFWRAFRNSSLDFVLFEPCSAYEGYEWYDRLPRITGLRHFISDDGECAEVLVAEEAGDRRRVDKIEIEATIRQPDGDKQPLRLDTDLLLVGDPWVIGLCDVGIFAAKDSDIDPGGLTDLLCASYFWVSDDAEADSADTQLRAFLDEAQHIATGFLLSEHDANVALLERAIRNDLLWLIPPAAKTVITVTDGDIRIEQIPA